MPGVSGSVSGNFRRLSHGQYGLDTVSDVAHFNYRGSRSRDLSYNPKDLAATGCSALISLLPPLALPFVSFTPFRLFCCIVHGNLPQIGSTANI